MQALFNATGYASDKKFELLSKQVRYFLGEDTLKHFDTLDFQQYVALEFGHQSVS
jgi:hypothetical protein